MKKSYIKPEAIEFEVQKMDGSIIELKIDCITGKQVEELSKIDVTTGNAISKQLACLFGGKEEDYADIDIRTTKMILEDITEMIQNPKKG